MELFRIRCVTCQARLSVRNRSAIGQIVGCPKCGSMVEIAPPNDWVDQARGDESQIAVRVTESSMREPPHSSEVDAASVDAPVPTDAASSSALLAPNQSGPALDEFDLPELQHPTTDNTTAQPQVAEQPPASDFDAAAGALKFKLIAWTAAVAVGGSLVIGGWILWGGGRPNQQPANHTTSVESPDDRMAPVLGQATGEEDVELRPDGALDIETAPAEQTSAIAELPELPLPKPDEPSSHDEESAASALERTIVNVPSEPVPSDNSLVESTSETPQPRIDPFEVDPEGLDLSLLFGRSADVRPSNSAGEPPGPPDEPTDAEQIEGDDPSSRPSEVDAVRLDPEGSPDGDEVEPAVVLERQFPHIEVQSMPLCRFVDFATQLSGVQVSVSPDQLRMAGMGPAAEISVKLDDASLDEILNSALRPLRLTATLKDSQLVLLCTRAQDLRAIPFPVDDLTSNSLSKEEIATWLKKLAAPQTWNASDVRLQVQGDRLLIRQHEAVQYEILVLLEKLRRAQGEPVRSGYPANLIPQQSPYVELAERLGGPATFTYSRYTPLRSIFRDWQEELSVPILVDWPALGTLQLGPGTRIACGVDERSWEVALDTVLQPMGLAWRAVDGPAIQITTAEACHGESNTHVYRLADGASVDAERAAAYVQRLADDLEGATPPATASIAHPTAPIVLLRQPAIVHRQLVDWLNEAGALPAKVQSN